ncbi:hypothetical protein C6Y40_11305 [Alteromonas alba]|uniref:Uncharacterized protein n=1 Tax=Alteromonas alba TaxID=2079529 RepID=A0A2S9VAP0_9ALTE|nr:hypothetical protein [Alteromonas alba]PRO73494.1 hypothetical protein C6Y40_11305 [Alteromonas alba]
MNHYEDYKARFIGYVRDLIMPPFSLVNAMLRTQEEAENKALAQYQRQMEMAQIEAEAAFTRICARHGLLQQRRVSRYQDAIEFEIEHSLNHEENNNES